MNESKVFFSWESKIVFQLISWFLVRFHLFSNSKPWPHTPLLCERSVIYFVRSRTIVILHVLSRVAFHRSTTCGSPSLLWAVLPASASHRGACGFGLQIRTCGCWQKMDGASSSSDFIFFFCKKIRPKWVQMDGPTQCSFCVNLVDSRVHRQFPPGRGESDDKECYKSGSQFSDFLHGVTH